MTDSAGNAKFPWRIFSVVLIGTFLGPLGGLMVGVALPTLSRVYHVDLNSTVWVLLSYLVTTTFMLPIVGRLGTQYGLKRIYVSGFLIDLVGTILCAMAPTTSIAYLVGYRVIQALGSVMVFALFSAIITRYVPGEKRGMAFGMTGGMVAISMLIGFPLAGALCAHASWQWIFWVQVPIQLLGLFIGLKALPDDVLGERQAFNPLSVISWLGMMAGFAVIAECFKGNLASSLLIWLSPAWLACIAVFIAAERGSTPLFEYSIFRRRPFWVCALGLMLNNFAVQVWLIFTTYYLEDYLGMNQLQSGRLLGLSLLATFFSAPLAGRLVAEATDAELEVIADLRLSVTRHLLSVAATLPELTQYTVPVDAPALVIAYELYGDPRRGDELVARNRIQHPLFVRAGTVLEALRE